MATPSAHQIETNDPRYCPRSLAGERHEPHNFWYEYDRHEYLGGHTHGRYLCDGEPDVAEVFDGDPVTHGTHGDSASVDLSPAATKANPEPIWIAPRLADSLLAIYADALDDIERTRISQENRVRALRQVKGMSDSPEAVRLDALIDQLKALEHGRVLELQRAMRSHPLGPWQKAQCGIGAKQLARLLACIGDPYWHRLYDRPRQVSELWAFCGLHVFRLDHVASEAHKNCAGTDSLGSANQSTAGPHLRSVGAANLLGGDLGLLRRESQTASAGVAARSVKGRKSNWSVEAKQRAYLVAESCVKHVGSPYRPVYDERRIVTAERTHVAPCPRCGPSGHPAAVGSPWSKGHQHADALRIVSKTILRDLWIESRRLHEMEQV